MTRVLAAALAVLHPDHRRLHGQRGTGAHDQGSRIRNAEGDPNRRICREKTITGSRLAKSKVCRTAREWADLNAANFAAAKHLQRPGGLDTK